MVAHKARFSNDSTPTSSSPDELLRNPSSDDIPWVVQKYGGTSVGKSLDSICKIVDTTNPRSYIPNSRVALVCSARSSHTKALGTTNLLLQASKQALEQRNISGTTTPFFPKRVGSEFFGSAGGGGGETPMISSISSLRELDIRSSSPSPFTSSSSVPPSPSASTILPSSNSNFNETVDTIRKGHLEAARQAVRAGVMRDELEDEIERDCEILREFLNAAKIIDEISPRSQDSIIGTGERLACKIVAAGLRDKGIDSEFVCLDNIVDSAMASASETTAASGDQGVAQLGQEFYDALAIKLGERIRECGNRVPVITGYFGPVPGSLLSQIGRGYTDLCAALCAVGLSASELQVWKEVDGIFTADPRKVPSARLVPVITPDEAAELTYYGSEVIHPFTMEQVIRAKIPIRIKNVENPTGSGTIIYPDTSSSSPTSTSSSSTPNFETQTDTQTNGHTEKSTSLVPNSKLPTAVTIKDNIIVLNIHSNRKTISHGFLARIFGTLDKTGVVVDLISTSEVHVSMAMQEFHNKKRLDRLVRDLEKIGDITVSKDMAILSLVGRNMRHAVGCAGMMFTALAKAGVNIEMISQGASEINISCDSSKALNVIHDSCLSVTSPTQFTVPL